MGLPGPHTCSLGRGALAAVRPRPGCVSLGRARPTAATRPAELRGGTRRPAAHCSRPPAGSGPGLQPRTRGGLPPGPRSARRQHGLPDRAGPVRPGALVLPGAPPVLPDPPAPPVLPGDPVLPSPGPPPVSSRRCRSPSGPQVLLTPAPRPRIARFSSPRPGPARTHLSAPCPASSPAGRAPHTARAAPRRRPSPSMSSLPGLAPASGRPGRAGGGGREGPRRAASVRPSAEPGWRCPVGRACSAPPLFPAPPSPRPAPQRPGALPPPLREDRAGGGTRLPPPPPPRPAPRAPRPAPRAPRLQRTPVSRSAAEQTSLAERTRADPSPNERSPLQRLRLRVVPPSANQRVWPIIGARVRRPLLRAPSRRKRSGSWTLGGESRARSGRGPGEVPARWGRVRRGAGRGGLQLAARPAHLLLKRPRVGAGRGAGVGGARGAGARRAAWAR